MRLIDLNCNWALQYTRESMQYEPSQYPDVPSRVGQVEGYLTGVSAAVLACGRRPQDWAGQDAPWLVLGAMIARYEAEFPGRLLLGPGDVERWLAEPEGSLCWGLLAIQGLEFLVRTSADLDRLPRLFARGVRVFQLVGSGSGLLGGADVPGDDRGLSELGRAVLERLASLVPPSNPHAARPALDLSGLNPRSAADVLDWFEEDATRTETLLLARTHGAIEVPGKSGVGGPGPDNLRRFRALKGMLGLSVGPPFVASPSELREQIESAAAMPFGTQPGYDGIGIGTAFLDLAEAIPGLENPPRVVEWLEKEFAPPIASALAWRSAQQLLVAIAGFAN